MRTGTVKIRFWWVVITLWLCAIGQPAQALIEIEITKGIDSAIPIAVVPFAWTGAGDAPADVAAIVAGDLQRSGNFSPLNRDDLVATPTSGDKPRYENWRIAGADYLLIGALRPRGDGYSVDFQLYDVLQRRLLQGLSLPVTTQSLRNASHAVADEVYEAILGIPGAFNSQIAFVAVEGAGRERTYRLELADADGQNPQPMLTSRRPIMSPAWAPDGIRIAYVSFENPQRSAIYVQNREEASRTKVISIEGINGAPAFSPDGQRLAIVLSDRGNADIYTIDIETGQRRRVTDSSAIDTEPVWVDDETLIFTSDRSGGPQLYEVPITGGRASRLTFDGQYNASATVSPDGRTVAFVHGTDTRYRIASLDRQSGLFQILSDGTLDESPSFAPNGQMVLFATERGGRGTLGAVAIDGSVEQSLSLDSGSVREPAWSPAPGTNP